MAILRHPGWPGTTVSVRYFAGAQAAAGVAEEQVVLTAAVQGPGTLTLQAVIEELIARHGEELAKVLAASSFIVDEVASGPDRPIEHGARIDVLPPFAGG